MQEADPHVGLKLDAETPTPSLYERSTFAPKGKRKSVEPRKKSKHSRMAKKKTASVAADAKLAVAIKEMTMNRLDFGEVIFGGNLQQNLQVEATMNTTVKKKTFDAENES